MRRVFFIGTTVVAVLASLAAWHWRSERITAIARNAEAQTRRAAAESRPKPKPAAPVAPVPVPAAPAPVPAAVPPAAAKPAEPTRAAWFEAMRPEAAEARRARDPRLQALNARKLRLELLLKNGAFLRGYALTGEQRERLLAAWVERELAVLDLRTLSREFGARSFGPEIQAEQQAVEKRMQETEAAVLGVEGSAALAEYRRTQPVRDFVGTAVGEAALAGFALSAEQADAVTAILVYSRGSRPATSVNQVDIAAAERQLASVLTAEQAELLLLPLRARAASSKLSQAVFAAVKQPKLPSERAPR